MQQRSRRNPSEAKAKWLCLDEASAAICCESTCEKVKPGVGPEHAHLRDTGRARYVGTTDEEALDAFRRLTRTEGIIPALEPSHALARVADLDAELVVLCLSGRGDKDLAEVLERP